MNKWCPGHSSRFDFLIYSHFSKTETFFSPVMFKMSCSHKIWGQCLSYGCYRVGPTLKIRVLLSHSGMRTLQDLQAGKYWSCHPHANSSKQLSCFISHRHWVKVFSNSALSPLLHMANKEIYRWSKGRFRPSKTCLKSNPDTNQFKRGYDCVQRIN